MTSYKEQLNKISTFIFDVDGVLTNGKVTIFKDEMVRTLNTKDAYAIQYASKMGYTIFVITGGKATYIKERLLELGCKEVIIAAANKISSYNELKYAYHFSDEEALYMGDDIPDYEVMKTVGLATCPQDAAMEIKAISHYQSPHNGGENCVRDIIEQTLRVQDKWFKKEAFTW